VTKLAVVVNLCPFYTSIDESTKGYLYSLLNEKESHKVNYIEYFEVVRVLFGCLQLGMCHPVFLSPHNFKQKKKTCSKELQKKKILQSSLPL